MKKLSTLLILLWQITAGQSLTLLPGQIQLPVLDFETLENQSNPEEGTVIYQPALNCLAYYNGTRWNCIGETRPIWSYVRNSLAIKVINATSMSEVYDIKNQGDSALFSLVKIQGTVSVLSSTINATATYDYLLIRADSALNPVWYKKISFTGEDFHLSRIKQRANGDILLVGHYKNGSLAYNGSQLQSHTGSPKSFVMEVNAVTGSLNWHRKPGSSGSFKTYDMAVRANGDLFLVGRFEANAQVLGSTLPSTGGAFVMLLNNDATAIKNTKTWHSNSNYLKARFIEVNNTFEYVNVVSEFTDSLSFFGQSLHTNSPSAIFVQTFYYYNASNLIAGGVAYTQGGPTDSLGITRFERNILIGEAKGSHLFNNPGTYINSFGTQIDGSFAIGTATNNLSAYFYPIASTISYQRNKTKIHYAHSNNLLISGSANEFPSLFTYPNPFSQQSQISSPIEISGSTVLYSIGTRTSTFEAISPVSVPNRIPYFTEMAFYSGGVFYGLNYFNSYCEIDGIRFQKPPSAFAEAVLLNTKYK
ncbi:hypothetical protein [Jiulongibacter sediminis]|uniref:Uncharacterized protein n=1 Tax=Jiulongibacter sediminis TaxID=1605367 RepID=A0A0P7BJL2_9BACT|nr:hypothetical protein [Jiulongibacter sediminis]KPM47392.1 hypothetical protein AFM12_14655 [Jiulongibacter sediminis]TBX22972.1 hypothetical protein TK44_14665 [Jiulongibacter sediminis]